VSAPRNPTHDGGAALRRLLLGVRMDRSMQRETIAVTGLSCGGRCWRRLRAFEALGASMMIVECADLLLPSTLLQSWGLSSLGT
jgi:hypothetical protein